MAYPTEKLTKLTLGNKPLSSVIVIHLFLGPGTIIPYGVDLIGRWLMILRANVSFCLEE